MRILYLSQLMPYPPDSGPKVRQYYTLRYLAQHHEVTLVAFSRPDDPHDAFEHMQGICAAVHTVPMVRSRVKDAISLAGSWVSGESFIIRRDTVPKMTELVKREIADGKYEIIQADQLWMAQYGLLGAGSGARLVLDEHNACFQIFQRLAQGEKNPLKRIALEREWRALRRFEGWACSRFDRLVTVTEEDRSILEGLIREPATNVEITKPPTFTSIPICVDTASVPAVRPVEGSQDVLLLGTMFWPPNIEGALWFAHQVWPRVKERLPGATFTIVGKNPPEAVRSLAGEGSGISVTGYVPDPMPYLERAAAFVVPLFSAGGMRVKIVDGWRWGLPVVSTTIGAEGLRYTDGDNIIIADNAGEFAAAIGYLLEDRELNRRMRQNGRRWVEEKYDWERVYPAWEDVYRQDEIKMR